MKIEELLEDLLHKIYGKEVRQSFVDAIRQCYNDATGHPESVSAVVKENDKMKKLLENTPYCEYEEGSFEDMELPINTINDDAISAFSTYSSRKIEGEFSSKTEVEKNVKSSMDEAFAKALEAKESRMIGIKDPLTNYVSTVTCTNRHNVFCACVYGNITLSQDLPAGASVTFAAQNPTEPGRWPKSFRAASITRWGKTVAIVEVDTSGNVTLKNPTATPLTAQNAIPFRVDYMAV